MFAVGSTIAVPGLGLVVAGPIAAALAGAGAGAAAGGLIGAMVGAGIPEDRGAKEYKRESERVVFSSGPARETKRMPMS